MDTSAQYYRYILKSVTAERHYVGISSDPHRRLEYHNTIEKGFTSRYRPWKLLYIKEYPSKADAQAAERTVKGWKSRKMIERIISGELLL